MNNPLLISYQTHKREIDAAVKRVFESGTYILGEEVKAFERDFSGYIGVKHGIGVASGTDAITIALKACGIGRGDEVITVSHTAVATVAAIELTGATPVLVDINPNTYTLDPECFFKAITSKTKAVIPVHLYGHPADMNAIVNIAHGNNIFVIEDCAQSHGALYRGKKTGSHGDIAAFSFYPTKNLGAIGDAGMIVTDSTELAEKARLLQQYGWKERNKSIISGMNSRLDELQAAILRVKLQYLDTDNINRRINADIYGTQLQSPKLVLPHEDEDAFHVYHQYVIRTTKRDELKKYLAFHGIDTAILQPAYEFSLGNPRLPKTETVCRKILSLPMHPYVDKSLDICKLITAFIGGI
jgi:dTDP-4-amino-4,6-dideoxygalactose transaminase